MTDGIWQRASACGGGGNNCVEVAANGADSVALRDSMRPDRVVATNRTMFRALIHGLKSGEFAPPPA